MRLLATSLAAGLLCTVIPPVFAADAPQADEAAVSSAVDVLLQKVQHDIQTAKHAYTRELQRRQAAEAELKRLRGEVDLTQQEGETVRRSRDLLEAQVHDLQGRIEAVQDDMRAAQHAVEAAQAQIASLKSEKVQLSSALVDARKQAFDAERTLNTSQRGDALALQARDAQLKAAQLRLDEMSGQLTTERTKVAGLQQAHDELAGRVEKQAGQIETDRTRLAAMDRALTERDRQLGMITDERDKLAQQVASMSAQLEAAQKRIAALDGEVSTVSARALLAEDERERLAAQVREQHTVLTDAQEELKRLHWQSMVHIGQRQDAEAKKAAAEKALAEQAADVEESGRLARLHEHVAGVLAADIAKGHVAVEQAADQLRVIVPNRILFFAGLAKLKPEGASVLRRVSDVLREAKGTQVRVEGHTDNVPIGQKIRAQFSNNLELSTARADTVVRWFVDEGGVAGDHVSGAGFADSRPISANDTPEGKAANRRLEILLQPATSPVVVSRSQP
jgi:chemotaxis protein MotB